MTEREKIVEQINKLFYYTDEQIWSGLKSEVFSSEVYLDMTSMGGTAATTSPDEICKQWKQGFRELDAVNHLAGNYMIQLQDDQNAEVKAYATATHFKKNTVNGNTREFVGTYEFKLRKEEEVWKIHSFIYHLKFATGNIDLT